MSKVKVWENKMKIGRAFGMLTDVGSPSYTIGSVHTKYGIVTVYSQGDEKNYHHTQLRIIIGGVEYWRSFKRRYTHIGLARISNIFAKDKGEPNVD